MLTAHIIQEIIRREEECKEREGNRLFIELPELQEDGKRSIIDKENPESEREVTIIDYFE